MPEIQEMKVYHRTPKDGLACYKDNERCTVEGVNELRNQVIIDVEDFFNYIPPVLVLIQGGKA